MTAEAAPARGGLPGWQIRKLQRLAEADPGAFDYADLAQEVGLSPFHFHRAFQTSMGVPPGRWLTELRLERARTLLETSTLTVSEVARTVGYRGAPQLTRAFKARFVVSPSQYRSAATGRG